MTIRARPRTRPFADAKLAAMVVSALAEQRDAVGCWVGAYCVMPDHIHYICAAGEKEVSVLELRRRLKGITTNRSWELGWSGGLWQVKGHDRCLRDDRALIAASEYVLNNPVRAGLVEEPEDWPWSGTMDGSEG